MPELTLIQQIAVWIIPVLFAITLHEAAHAWTAWRLGDNTAKQLGRVSANPINHIDLLGTIIIPISVLIISHFNFVFGWAKPVPINASHFVNPRRDLALAVAAGPMSNLMMAFLWAIILKISIVFHPQLSTIALFIILTARAGIIINLLLAFLNLVPIPPLDGGKIMTSLLPMRQALAFEKIEPYGFFILLAMMFSGILNWLISAPINGALVLLSKLFHI